MPYATNTFLSHAHAFQIDHSNFTAVGGDQNNITNTYHGAPPMSQRETGLQHLHYVISDVGALHDSAARFPPPKCHPETRKEVLEQLSCWIKADPFKKSWAQMIVSRILARASHLITADSSFIFSHTYDFSPIQWLHGPAGVGKSAIAQTLCESFDISHGSEHHLVASFFFSRSSSTRDNPKYLFLTIAYCLATFSNDSKLRAAIDRVVKRNPAILEASIDTQFQELVVRPLQSLSLWRQRRLPKIVIIDGLDECIGAHLQHLVLETIRNGLVDSSSKGPMYKIPLRFLIASRPEPAIRNIFSQPNFYKISSRTILDNSWATSRDIAIYLHDGLSHIARKFQDETTSIPKLWPLDGAIDEIVQRASGQFIYAATVLKYVGDEGSYPPERLEVVLGLPLRDTEAFADLDALYHQILLDNPTKQKYFVVQILEFVLVTQKMSNIKRLAEGLPLPSGILSMTFRGLHSVLEISPDFVRIYHKSFEDFLCDKQRSQEYYIGDIHKHFLESFSRMKNWDQLVDDPDAFFRTIPLPTHDKDQMHVLETLLALQTHVKGPIPMDIIAFCCGIPVAVAAHVLSRLKCVLLISDHNEFVQIRIQSFQSFLMDYQRSGVFQFAQPQFNIDGATRWCFKILQQIKHENTSNPTMCGSLFTILSMLRKTIFRQEEFALKNCLGFMTDVSFNILGEMNSHILKLLMESNTTLSRYIRHMIIEAARQGHLHTVKFLIKNDNKAMFEAAREGHLDIVKFLVKNGVAINTTAYGQEGFALHGAAIGGHLRIVKFLLENGADINVKLDGEGTAMHKAAEGGHLEVMMFLAHNGADCTTPAGYWNKTPLHSAAENGNVNVIKFLLEIGTDVDVQDKNGRAAVHYAANTGKLDAIKFLINMGATVDVETSREAAAQGHLDVLKWFIKTGVDVNIKKALHDAAYFGHLNIAKFLVKKGADVNATLGEYHELTTALHGAAYRGKLDIIKLLLNNNAKVNICNGAGQTALDIAMDRKHSDVIHFLKEKGAGSSSHGVHGHWTGGRILGEMK